MASKNQVFTLLGAAVIVIGVIAWLGVSRQSDVETPLPTASVPDQALAVKIGWLGSVSDETRGYTDSVKRGIELAREDVDAPQIEIIWQESRCDSAEAIEAANTLIAIHKVSAMIGALCPEALAAAAPVAQQAEVVFLNAAETGTLLDTGKFVFSVVPSSSGQAQFTARTMYEQGVTRLAVLTSGSEEELRFSNELMNSFKQLGGQMVAQEVLKEESDDIRLQLTKIRAGAPQALYVLTSLPDSAVAILKHIDEFNLTLDLYGSQIFRDEKVLEAADEAAEGLTIISVSTGTPAFVARYQAEYGEPPVLYAAHGYDVLVALVRAMSEGGVSGSTIAQVLPTVEFDGASGHIRFNERGEVAGSYDVLAVREGQPVSLVASPSPSIQP